MAVSHLQCKECKAQYPLEALYVCETCFGPLEAVYDHSRTGDDVGELRRRIQGGPQNIWRYADFLPLAGMTHIIADPALQARDWQRVFAFFDQHLRREP